MSLGMNAGKHTNILESMEETAVMPSARCHTKKSLCVLCGFAVISSLPYSYIPTP